MPKEKKVIMFGASDGGKRLFDKIKSQYKIVCFTDNDPSKWGESLFGLCIHEPDKVLLTESFDYVIITSAPGLDSIYKQLIQMNIAPSKIVTEYIRGPLESRRQFLENLSWIMDKKVNGNCAEVGVFEGDFAKYINEYFNDKKLYLFDTFEGFDQKDIDIEVKNEFSQSSTGDYSNTTVDMVMGKMLFPENCIVKKGYFPDTVLGLDEEFCFVNLDLDLYQPTLEGLLWFSKRVAQGGVILIHDYFADNFKGPKHAVDDFLQLDEGKGLNIVPIGDGLSVMVIGFKNIII